MSIMRSTFREIQNAILSSVDGNKDNANQLFEALLVGEVKDGVVQNKSKDALKNVIERFTIPIRLAKEVYERGDFVNIITSDLLSQQPDRFVFVNRIRRVDGEEFQFITDPESTIHLLQHFLSRIQDLERSPEAKKTITEHKKDLVALKAKIDQLIG
jgi:transcription elongation factor